MGLDIGEVGWEGGSDNDYINPYSVGLVYGGGLVGRWLGKALA